MTQNPLISITDDSCSGCGSSFIRNMIDFEVLPLVEFAPSKNMPHKKVIECLRMDPPEGGKKAGGPSSGYGGRGGGNYGGDGW